MSIRISHLSTCLLGIAVCLTCLPAVASAEEVQVSSSPLATKAWTPTCSPECEVIFAPLPSAVPGLEYEGSGPEGGFTPQELRSAYHLPDYGGSESTIAVVDGLADPRAESDLAAYRERFGLPKCTEGNGCFSQVNENGEPHKPKKKVSEWIGEISLDLDMVSAACPECHIVLMEGSGRSGMVKADEEAVNKLGVTAVTNSWNFGFEEGNPANWNVNCSEEPCISAKEEEEYDPDFHHPGTPIFFSGGDYGYAVRYPAVSGNVISVGGTALEADPESGRGWTESVWSHPSKPADKKGRGTGSGCSIYEAKPAWETDGACSKRIENDVAAVADPSTPVAVYDSYEGGWKLAGGTSASAPFVAGVEGLSPPETRALGAKAFWSAEGQEYLFDVTQGSDGACTPPEEDGYWCQAGIGFDGPTGWGTPDGPIGFSPRPEAATEAASHTDTLEPQLRATVNPEGSDTHYYFEYDTSEYGEGEGPHGTKVPAVAEDIGSGTTGVAVSQTLGGLEPGTVYHYRVVAENEGGTVRGADAAFAAPAPAYMSSFGSEGAGSGQFRAPRDVAVDAKGDLWVADSGNDRIEEFSPAGAFIRQFGSEGGANGQLEDPTALAIDAKGDVWVADSNNDRIEEFSEAGKYIRKVGKEGTKNGQFEYPEGIAVDAKGDVWVSDTWNGRVQEFSPEGKFIRVVGSKGSGPGQLELPEGIAIGPGGNVWVLDWWTDRVEEFDEMGKYLRQFGSEGQEAGQFEEPNGLEVDGEGDIWVIDGDGFSVNNRVEEFNEAGEYITQFGSTGAGPGQFSFAEPDGLAVDSNGNIWVADGGNDRVERWTR